MVIARSPTEATYEGDHIVLTHGMSWEAFEAFLEARGEASRPRIAYAHETLEQMSPSRRHEDRKSLVGSLLEAYLFEKNIYFVFWGSTTLKNAIAKKAAEPDESYAFAKGLARPDLAIEAVLSSGGLKKLEIYRDLGVTEVWFWTEKGIEAFALGASGYAPIETSVVIPELSIALIAGYAARDDAFEAVTAFRAALRET